MLPTAPARAETPEAIRLSKESVKAIRARRRDVCAGFLRELARIAAGHRRLRRARPVTREKQRAAIEARRKEADAFARGLGALLVVPGLDLDEEAARAGKSGRDARGLERPGAGFFVSLLADARAAERIFADMLTVKIAKGKNSRGPLPDLAVRSLAYDVARAMQRHGLKPTSYESGLLAVCVRVLLRELGTPRDQEIKTLLRPIVESVRSDPSPSLHA